MKTYQILYKIIRGLWQWVKHRRKRKQVELSEEVSQLLGLEDEYDYADYD